MLFQIPLQNHYKWGKREETKKGSPLMSVVEKVLIFIIFLLYNIYNLVNIIIKTFQEEKICLIEILIFGHRSFLCEINSAASIAMCVSISACLHTFACMRIWVCMCVCLCVSNLYFIPGNWSKLIFLRCSRSRFKRNTIE